ncbi:MAG TPA: MOSC domain-containing protein [Gemmatimonadales bacterium]|jgi:MOSC domain-containing protein YiiM|nr:MOSC domain-containing protein [Gemmatimonadales bacterium]
MKLESVQVGQPRTYGTPGAEDPLERPWTSAIRKEPVDGPVWAGREGLSGDHQYDRTGHGGPERALLMYSADHYPLWRGEWGRKDVGPGGFGENLTVSGLSEDTACVGDVFRIGAVRIEVSSPRGPCSNLARRHGIPDLVRTVMENHRSGWYLRVLHEGWLEAGAEVVLADRPFPQWTIRRVADIKRHRADRREEAELLAACPALQTDWRRKLGSSEAGGSE